MRLADGYRLLELDPSASDEEVKRAYRDLTKVWHPDRFAQDPALRHRAEEKLKTIHAAYDTVLSARASGAAEPGEGEAALAGRRVGRYRTRALLAAAVALFLLFRRPTPAGLVLALGLFGLSVFYVFRMQAAGREATSSAPRGTGGP